MRLTDVLVQRIAAKIEEAILQANVFRIVELAEDRQRQFLGGGEHFDFLRKELDLAGRHDLLIGVVRASLDLAVEPDNPFAAHGFCQS